MSTYIIAIVILTLFSGLFSATETAYSSSSKIRLKTWQMMAIRKPAVFLLY